jgi:hypothetical protein
MPSRNKKNKKITFRAAIKMTRDVQSCYQKNLQALKSSERRKVKLAIPDKCGGSLFIDQCLVDQGKYPNENRWDYAIDYNGEIIFIEFHSANTSEVETVIKKLEWLKIWLRQKAPEIDRLKSTTRFPYYWIQSSGFQIPLQSAQYRRIVQLNLKPISRLVLS